MSIRKIMPISFAVVIAATVIPLMRLQDGCPQAEDDSIVKTEIAAIAETNETEKEYTVYQSVVDADDTYISEEIQKACIEIGDKNGYCPELLMAIIESESSGRQYAENGSCKGLMQINMSNSDVVEYMESHGYTDIYDIYTNIEMGCYVLDQKRAIFDDDLYAVLMSYNGSQNVRERVENEDYSDYAVRIVERSWELERLHGK